ncbi:MAG: BamA/TamA family outer membrane protein, partial [Bacteroidota bacterium]
SEDSEIKYIYDGRRLKYSPKILDRRIRLKPGERYSLGKITETQRSLGILDMFKFVNINPDTSQGHLNLHIYTTALDKYQITDEIGFNVIQGLPGPFVNVSLKTRNVFGGAEIFENSLRFAIDGQTSFSESDNFYSSQEIGINSSLTFPKILFPISNNLRYRLNQFNPTTKLNLGFNYVRRPEYTRTTLAASISYNGQLGYSTYQFTLADLNLVNTREISDEFRTQLLELSNRSILESFDRALVSSTYLVYTYNTNRGDERLKSQFIKFLIEGGGLSLSLLRGTSIIEENRILGLKVFQYWRFNPSYHYYMPLGKKYHNLVFRVNLGVVRPFGGSSTLPYEKFFFAGGSTSIRAWQPRRLGPGAYQPPVNEDGTFDFSIEQPGEILLEGNIEYRFPIFGYIRGALFLDAGNVWTFGEDSERPGSQFKFRSFLNQIALGSGFGIRFNLPFLLLRFDLGLKVYDPARRSDRRWVIRQFNPLRPFEQDFLLLNIGIGYPF